MDFFLCSQFPRSDAKSHSQTQIESHLQLVLRGLEATQHQFHELVAVVQDQSKQIERQSQQIERQSQQIERQSQRIERQSQQIERLISKDKEQAQQIERQSQQIERLISKDKDQSQQTGALSENIKRLISKDKKPSEKMEPPQREQRGPINQIFLRLRTGILSLVREALWCLFGFFNLFISVCFLCFLFNLFTSK